MKLNENEKEKGQSLVHTHTIIQTYELLHNPSSYPPPQGYTRIDTHTLFTNLHPIFYVEFKTQAISG